MTYGNPSHKFGDSQPAARDPAVCGVRTTFDSTEGGAWSSREFFFGFVVAAQHQLVK